MKQLFIFLLSSLLLLACQKDEQAYTANDQGTTSAGEDKSVDERLITQLEEVAQPLSTTNPLEWTNEDLRFLDKVADKKIVGLGEATHGTSEFFKAKHRIFQYLVEQHGFKVFAFEADFGESLFINQAIQEGRVADIRGLMIKYMHFWTWKTEEVLDLLEWMATYNQGKAAEDKVQYMGVDCQYNTYNPQWVMTYLQKHDEEFYLESKELLEGFTKKTRDLYDKDIPINDAAYESDKQELTKIAQLFENRKDQLVEASSIKEYELHLKILEVVKQTFEVAYQGRQGQGVKFRDQYMAENTMWLPKYFQDEKVVLWAHNYHVSRTDNGPSMGKVMSNNYGANYHIIGFTFSTGGFTAVAYDGTKYLGLRTFELTKTPETNSINYLFSKAAPTNFAINLFELADQAQWTSLFLTQLPTYISIGSVFNNVPEDYYTTFYSAHYHDLIHIEKTTAAQQLQQ